MSVDPVHLEMTEPPRTAGPRPHRPGMLLRIESPTVRFYRYLSSSAGGRWPWSEMRDLTDDELAAVLVRDSFELFGLFVAGEPVGCFELEVGGPTTEIVQEGLVPEHRGSVLDRYLLHAAVETAWGHDPRRVVARVDGSADPQDVLRYQAVGFTVVASDD